MVVEQLRERVLHLVYFVQELLGRLDLVRHVASHDDLGEVCGESDFGRFGIDHEIDLRSQLAKIIATLLKSQHIHQS